MYVLYSVCVTHAARAIYLPPLKSTIFVTNIAKTTKKFAIQPTIYSDLKCFLNQSKLVKKILQYFLLT